MLMAAVLISVFEETDKTRARSPDLTITRRGLHRRWPPIRKRGSFLLLDEDGTQAKRGNFEVADPGLSEALALERGIELLTERHSTGFSIGITRKSP
jgi:hypothetical protein